MSVASNRGGGLACRELYWTLMRLLPFVRNTPVNPAMSDPYQPPKESQPAESKTRFIKPVVLVLLAIVVAVLFFRYREYLNLESMAAQEKELREYQSQHPVLVYGIAFVAYVVATGLSLPGAAALTLVMGWYFGFWPALLMISFASTIGATMAFLLSRYFLGGWVQEKFGNRLVTFNEQLEEKGAFFLFSLRLVPAVPFFVINLVMGLTKMKTWTFYWVSQIGMLLGTAVYVYAGSRVPDLNTLAADGVKAVFSASQLLQIAIAFTLLGLFPLITKLVLSHFSSKEESLTPDVSDPA